jgi:hypothetical protein
MAQQYRVELYPANPWAGRELEGCLGLVHRPRMTPAYGCVRDGAAYLFDSEQHARRELNKLSDEFHDRYDAVVVPVSADWGQS